MKKNASRDLVTVRSFQKQHSVSGENPTTDYGRQGKPIGYRPRSVIAHSTAPPWVPRGHHQSCRSPVPQHSSPAPSEEASSRGEGCEGCQDAGEPHRRSDPRLLRCPEEHSWRQARGRIPSEVGEAGILHSFSYLQQEKVLEALPWIGATSPRQIQSLVSCPGEASSSREPCTTAVVTAFSTSDLEWVLAC